MSDAWFSEFSAFHTKRRLSTVRRLLSPLVLDLQDSYGMTATHLAVANDWMAALDLLLEARPNLELRHHRTGETPLGLAVGLGKAHFVRALLAAGANPDAANHDGFTPRERAETFGVGAELAGIPGAVERPTPLVQNAEHLAAHYYPRFDLPSRAERERLRVGQAVDIYVRGSLKPRIKVRIVERRDDDAIRYVARVETTPNNLPPGTETVTFGPEHVTTVWVPALA